MYAYKLFRANAFYRFACSYASMRYILCFDNNIY